MIKLMRLFWWLAAAGLFNAAVADREEIAVGDFTLVPLVVGGASPEQLAALLDRLWGGPETLIVISSDLSHFHDYATATKLDRATSDAIEALRFEEEALEPHEETLAILARPGRNSWPGSRRPLRVPLGDLEWSWGDDAFGDHLELRFSLPPGSYASIVALEIGKGELRTG